MSLCSEVKMIEITFVFLQTQRSLLVLLCVPLQRGYTLEVFLVFVCVPVCLVSF